jgi:hypothetical protein
VEERGKKIFFFKRRFQDYFETENKRIYEKCLATNEKVLIVVVEIAPVKPVMSDTHKTKL